MGYQGYINEGQFQKGMFPLICRFLIHHVIHHVAIVYNRPFNISRLIIEGLVVNAMGRENDKFLMYSRFLKIIFNGLLPNLPTIGATHVL